MVPESGPILLILKACGSVIGTALALVFVPPATRSDFWRRLGLSFLAGVVFSFVPHIWLGFPSDIEGTVAAACLMAFGAWGLAGAVQRIAETFSIKKD